MRKPAGKILKKRELYEDYKLLNPTTKVTYSQYCKVLEHYYTGIVELLLAGYTWELGYNLQSIRIQKVVRRFSRPQVDHYETKKLRLANPELVDSVVYYTSKYYYRYYWNKNSAKIPNRSAYRFDVTKGVSSSGKLGNSRKLAKVLNTNPLAHLKFLP